MSPLINLGHFARDIKLAESITSVVGSPDFIRLVLDLEDDRALRTKLTLVP